MAGMIEDQKQKSRKCQLDSGICVKRKQLNMNQNYKEDETCSWGSILFGSFSKSI